MTLARATPHRSLALEHHRPRYHVRPPRGHLNDPNGPVRVGEETHLYFQYRQTVDLDEPVLWGHASTTDLVHWRLHRPAMAPDPEGPDRDGCWSGNTVIGPDGNVHAFYSGFLRDEPFQSALTAVSTDGGMSFGTPRRVVEDPDSRIRTYRDPFVWAEGAEWRMVVGAGDQRSRASARLYASPDLERWDYLGDLAALPRIQAGDLDTGAMWECPQVVDVDGKRVLLVGAWSEESGILRVLSILPGEQGEPDPERVLPVDEGPNFYAASVLRTGPHGPLMWGWVTEGRDVSWWREAGWAGVLSLPRRLALGDDGRLLSFPVPELERLRASAAGQRVRPGEAAPLSAQAELLVEASGSEVRRVRFEFGEEFADLVLHPAHGTVVLERDDASLDPRAHRGRVVVEGAGDGAALSVRAFLDGSVLELFTATGRAATARLYPTTPPPWRISCESGLDVRVWRLTPGA